MKTHGRSARAAEPALRGGGEGKLYSQIAGIIRRRIRETTWQPGDRLPSLDDLTDEFGVSLITVRRAVELLEKEGMLHRVQGRGTFVARAAIAREWLRLATDWDGILRGYEDNEGKLQNKVVRQKAGCILPIGNGDAAPPDYPFRFMRRLHLVDNVPYAYTDLYLAEHIHDGAPEDFATQMVLKVLASRTDIEIGRAYQTVTIGSAESDTATLLNMSIGAPVGELLRTVHDQSGNIIYQGNVTYRGDLVRIETRLK